MKAKGNIRFPSFDQILAEIARDCVFLKCHISRTDARNLTYNMSKIIRKKFPIEWCTSKDFNFKCFVFTMDEEDTYDEAF